MSEIKGNSLVAINNWLVEHLKGKYFEFLSRMREPVARTLTDTRGWAWYPVAYLVEIYNKISEELGNDNGCKQVLDELGRYIAEADLANLSKDDCRFLPMPRVLARLPGLWSRCKNCGQLEVLKVDPKSGTAELVLTGCGGGPMHQEVVRAWLEKVMGLIGNCKLNLEGMSYPWEAGDEVYYWRVDWK